MEINIEKMAQNVIDKVMQDLRDNGVFIGRWIPVNEGLPEKEGWYLCNICKRGDKAKVIRLWCWYHGDDIRWETYDGWKDWKARGWRVNAWMPLPASYEPQERKESDIPNFESEKYVEERLNNYNNLLKSGILDCIIEKPQESEDNT